MEKLSTHRLKTHLIPIHKGSGVTSAFKRNVNLIKRVLASRLGHENRFASTFSVLSPNRGSVAGKQWLASAVDSLKDRLTLRRSTHSS